MFDILKTRIAQGYRTARYPKAAPVLPDRFRGMPKINSAHCGKECRDCVDACPVHALTVTNNDLSIDLGRCIFCGKCEEACQKQCITFSPDHRMAARNHGDLVITRTSDPTRVRPLDKHRLNMFRRSFHLRQVSAGGCNACESDVNVLNTLTFDLSRFGIHFVASPRHADGLLITGPVTGNMERAVKKTYDAIPSPKVVIAVGACAISGGMFTGHHEARDGASDIVPVDLFIPGCPPHPYTILDGLLRLLGRVES